MYRILPFFLSLLIITSCNKEQNIDTDIPEDENSDFIAAVDISSYPEIANLNPTFKDLNGTSKNFLNILKENGVNTIRLRLWVHPNNSHSSFNEVKEFSETLTSLGFKTWLSLHYSNTWADPSQQETPTQWQGIPFNVLKDSVYNYTKKVVTILQPDYIQIGNEINTGFLHPYGHITNNYSQFISLLQSGVSAVKEYSPDTKTIMHFAGIENVDWFFNQVSSINYDIIGLSYYPIWHGKSLSNLKNTMQQLTNTHSKKVVIAETAYPFTLEWNDWTNNIVGLEDQLIVPLFPASPSGQSLFIKEIKKLTKEVDNGIGFCYWGAELIAWKGPQATDASPWENQALFDFENKALPVLKEFNVE